MAAGLRDYGILRNIGANQAFFDFPCLEVSFASHSSLKVFYSTPFTPHQKPNPHGSPLLQTNQGPTRISIYSELLKINHRRASALRRDTHFNDKFITTNDNSRQHIFSTIFLTFGMCSRIMNRVREFVSLCDSSLIPRSQFPAWERTSSKRCFASHTKCHVSQSHSNSQLNANQIKCLKKDALVNIVDIE